MKYTLFAATSILLACLSTNVLATMRDSTISVTNNSDTERYLYAWSAYAPPGAPMWECYTPIAPHSTNIFCVNGPWNAYNIYVSPAVGTKGTTVKAEISSGSRLLGWEKLSGTRRSLCDQHAVSWAHMGTSNVMAIIHKNDTATCPAGN